MWPAAHAPGESTVLSTAHESLCWVGFGEAEHSENWQQVHSKYVQVCPMLCWVPGGELLLVKSWLELRSRPLWGEKEHGLTDGLGPSRAERGRQVDSRKKHGILSGEERKHADISSCSHEGESACLLSRSCWAKKQQGPGQSLCGLCTGRPCLTDTDSMDLAASQLVLPTPTDPRASVSFHVKQGQQGPDPRLAGMITWNHEHKKTWMPYLTHG